MYSVNIFMSMVIVASIQTSSKLGTRDKRVEQFLDPLREQKGVFSSAGSELSVSMLYVVSDCATFASH